MFLAHDKGLHKQWVIRVSAKNAHNKLVVEETKAKPQVRKLQTTADISDIYLSRPRLQEMIETTGNGSSAIKSLAEAAVEADKKSKKQKKSMTKVKGKSHVLTVLASTCVVHENNRIAET